MPLPSWMLEMYRFIHLYYAKQGTICPRSSDPSHIIIYYISGSLLLGHTGWKVEKKGFREKEKEMKRSSE